MTEAKIGRFRPLWASLGLVAATLMALVPGALFRGETFYLHDLRAYHRPLRALLLRLGSGPTGLPLWNPFTGSGQPYAANPAHQLFHPLTALFFFLPFETAFRLQILLPILGTLGAMYFLLRTIGRSRAAALFGAMSWGLGGYVLSATMLLPTLFAVAPLPATLAFAIRFLRSGRRKDGAMLAAFFALECLVGEPVVLLATLLLLSACLAKEIRRPATQVEPARKRRRWLPVLETCAVLFLGAAIAAPVLLPAARLAKKTTRGEGIPRAESDLWSFPPVRAAEILSPHALGHADDEGGPYWGASLYRRLHRPYFLSLYPGLLAGVLALVAFVRRPRRLLPWIVAGGGGFLLACGENFPILHLSRAVIPFLGSIRFPEKFIVVPVLALAVAASDGFDQILFSRPPRPGANFRIRQGRSASSLTHLALRFLALAGALSAVAWWVSIASPGPLELARTAVGGGSPAFPIALRDAALAGAVAASGLLGLWFLRRGASGRQVVPVLLIFAADLVVAGRPLVRTIRPETLDRPPPFFESILDRPMPGPLFHAAAWSRRSQGKKELAEPPIPLQWGIPTTLEHDFDTTQLVWTRHAVELFWKAADADPALIEPLLQRRGVFAVLSFGAAGAPGVETVHLRILPRTRPFAFFVERVGRIAGEDGWLAAVRALQSDVTSTAIVDEHEPVPSFQTPSPGTVIALQSLPDRISLETEVTGPENGFLALNQTWDDGWSVRIDGHTGRLARTCISLSGIVVPPGRHRIELLYDDPSIRFGLALGVFGLVLTGAWFFSGSFLQRR